MNDPSSVPPDTLASLIQAGGRREAPPQWAYDRAYSAVTDAWRTKVHARRARTIAVLAASIAVLCVGAGLTWNLFGSRPQLAASIGEVERVIGSVQVRSAAGGEWSLLQETATAIPEGAELRTLAGSAAALQIRGVSVRISDRTELVLESEARLSLQQGTVYVDTRGGNGEQPAMLVVAGPTSVTDVGTQFEVRYQGGDYRVRVREGTVLLQRHALRLRGQAGDQITIDADDVVRSGEISTNDPAWDWILSLATAPDIDKQPLTVLLAWVARESGVKVLYGSPAIERKATATILHGSVQGLQPFEALQAMLATTDLQYELLPDGTILIK
jgi:ferric-dicitrate binding protein FerR (iron transport regulator)